MEGTVAEYDASALDSLLEQVYRKAGYDFREYKRGTLTRRLTRRLYVHGLGTYQEYRQFLDGLNFVSFGGGASGNGGGTLSLSSYV